MTKIVILGTGCICWTCCDHVTASIINESTNEVFKVNFGSQQTYDLKSATHYDHDVGIILYSDKKLNDFTQAYKQKFGNSKDYNFLNHNCADAVKFTLDYFFPNRQKKDCINYFWESVICPLWFFSGAMTCCAAPSCLITTPRDIAYQALSLTKKHGKPLVEQESKAETTLEETRLLTSAKQLTSSAPTFAHTPITQNEEQRLIANVIQP